MSRAYLVLSSPAIRAKAHDWINRLPHDTRVEFKEPKRSLPQNDRLWAMLSDIARQKEHCGRTYKPEVWKALMMHAWGREVKFIPALDGEGVIPMFYSSSDLSKQEMTDLIEFMFSWGAQNGVQFQEPQRDAA